MFRKMVYKSIFQYYKNTEYRLKKYRPRYGIRYLKIPSVSVSVSVYRTRLITMPMIFCAGKFKNLRLNNISQKILKNERENWKIQENINPCVIACSNARDIALQVKALSHDPTVGPTIGPTRSLIGYLSVATIFGSCERTLSNTLQHRYL